MPWWLELCDFTGKKVLTVGERNGGLSLFFALEGATVFCTDLYGVTDVARKKHERYMVNNRIEYQKANVLSLPFPNSTFDIVAFKSVLGSLETKSNQVLALQEIHRTLKDNGELLFAENLYATIVHNLIRSKTVAWGNRWRYIQLQELPELLSPFRSWCYSSYGAIALFGRSEKQRFFLSKVDQALTPILPASWRYILFAMATK